jgi:hypothetical protein
MRVAVKETEVYTYSELEESAQEKVREWYNQVSWEDGQGQESCQMLADNILEDVGFSSAMGLSYSLYSPGGDPTFESEGTFTHDDKDYTLTIGTRHIGAGTEVFELDLEPHDPDQETINGTAYLAAKEFVRELQVKMFNAFRVEDEYLGSDELVAEICEANEWEFTKDGRLY